MFTITNTEINLKLGRINLFKLNYHRFLTLYIPGVCIEFSWALPRKIFGNYIANTLLNIVNKVDSNGIRYQKDHHGFFLVTGKFDNVFLLPVSPSYTHIADFRRGYVKDLKSKYSLKDFVEVEAGDVVVDCGAHIGGFSFAYQDVAKVIHAFEPSPRNYYCLSKNINSSRVQVEQFVMTH